MEIWRVKLNSTQVVVDVEVRVALGNTFDIHVKALLKVGVDTNMTLRHQQQATNTHQEHYTSSGGIAR